MGPARLFFSVTAFIGMLFGSHAAGAATITTVWLGAEVSITHPDSVVYGETFDISFSVDSSTLPPAGTLAFKTFLDTSDTIDVADSTWEYIFSSDDPDWNLSSSGDLDDSVTPTTHDADGYSIRLFDPVNGERTWIWADYNDRVEWTLRDLVLLDDTTFALTLDEFLNGPTTFVFDVTGVPASAPVPAVPNAGMLVLCALLVGSALWAAGRTETAAG